MSLALAGLGTPASRRLLTQHWIPRGLGPREQSQPTRQQQQRHFGRACCSSGSSAAAGDSCGSSGVGGGRPSTMPAPEIAAIPASASEGKAAGSSPAQATPLSSLTHILNARDLAEASTALQPGRLFRCGSPAHASLEDVLLVRRELRVQQMIDFRSPEEHREDTAWSLMLSNGTIRTYDSEGRVTEVAIDHNAALHGVDLRDIALHRLSLMDRSRVMRGMLTKLPVRKLLWAGFYKLVGNNPAMRDTLTPEINRGGLPLIYQILMDTAGADIAKALQLITSSLERRQPCMFFCKLGKDRTGLMAALVLAACGVSEDEIVADYVRSDGVHQVALGGLEKDDGLKGLDEAVFSAAPPEAMRSLLQYAKERYGGLREYMISVGFDAAQQARLRCALTEKADGW